MGRVWWLLSLGLLVTWSAACTGKDEALPRPELIGEAGGETGGSLDPSRTGEPCADYQDALCDYVVRCRPEVKRDECDALAQAIVCLTDGRAEGCTLGIDSASCSDPPGDCELGDVADRAPARDACEAMADATCEAQGGCALNAAECAAVHDALACDSVIGVTSDLAPCLSELADPACEALPLASCQGLFISAP